MTISKDVKHRLAVALASVEAADAVAAAIAAGGNGPAELLADLELSTVFDAAATAGGATPSAADVNAAIDALAGAVHTRLNVIENKINAILGALTAAGLMA